MLPDDADIFQSKTDRPCNDCMVLKFAILLIFVILLDSTSTREDDFFFPFKLFGFAHETNTRCSCGVCITVISYL